MNSPCETSDLFVFSHLRWDSIIQRPHHLLSRFAQHRRVFYIEEPVYGMTDTPRLYMKETHEKVQVIVPHLPSTITNKNQILVLKDLLNEMIFEESISDYTSWYYTPEALEYTRQLEPSYMIYDCMMNVEGSLVSLEEEIMKKANLVFMASQPLFEVKKYKHQNIHSFANSLDRNHFSQGRTSLNEPDDLMNIPHPRIGFYGALDETFDFNLLSQLADLRPEYQFVILGPVSSSAPLPAQGNIHYLGQREYELLPLYLAGWDCVINPLIKNQSTILVSPSKTVESLAAGKPFVSTSLQDVMHPYGDAKLVYIADQAPKFAESIDKAMNESAYDPEWIERVDNFLDGMSWDSLFLDMAAAEISLHEHEPVGMGEFKIPAYMDQSLMAIGIV